MLIVSSLTSVAKGELENVGHMQYVGLCHKLMLGRLLMIYQVVIWLLPGRVAPLIADMPSSSLSTSASYGELKGFAMSGSSRQCWNMK